MDRTIAKLGRQHRRSDAADVVLATHRWYGTPLLLGLSVVLLTLSFAPFGQFYLAWVGLVPWLVVVGRARSPWTAFAWSWAGGTAFFIANMWWLAGVTGPGMVALMAVLGLYWGAAGWVIRASGALEMGRAERAGWRAVAAAWVIAVVWVSLEWLHGVWPLGGLPWLYLGHAQSPVLAMCQIADVTGVWGISLWVALVNAWIALFVLNGRRLRPLAGAGASILALLALVLAYGLFRMAQHTTTPGPVVMVVQPNYKQSNSGEKGAEQDEIEEFHLRMTEKALQQHPGVDLVVWSETMMGALNEQGRTLRELSIASVWEDTHQRIMALARRYHTALLVGGVYYDKWELKRGPKWDRLVPADRRNAAYFYDADGRQSPLRYDKVHLVPFGETLPFKTALPPLYRLFLALSPYTEEYTLTAGSPDALTVFTLEDGWRFVTPICFEDIDPGLVHRMFRPTGGRKRADFIVNITNDGWFLFNEMPQHLQAAIFRSIENRVPTARSVNTGISGFVDSVGRLHDLVPPHTEGTSIARLQIDSRVTFYSRFGDVFAAVGGILTAILAALLLGREIVRWWGYRTNRPDKAA